VSHPTFRHPTGSLLNAVLFHARSWPSPQRPSLVGRLDKHTSGAVIVAKSTDAHARLQRALAQPASRKEYLAIVHGPVRPGRGDIALRLRRDPDDRRRVVGSARDGAASLTRFERLAVHDAPPLALLRCELLTGRMHQIRVHLSASGWPIVGDRKYGRATVAQSADSEIAGDSGIAEAVTTLERQALHAWRVSFIHPFTGEHISVTAPLPQDLDDIVEKCDWNLTI
jgi:23S rRNA pseudouridine1911/1915/1917 synthase